MDVEEYLNFVFNLAAACERMPERDFEAYVAEILSRSDAKAYAEFRSNLATQDEVQSVSGYLELGYFQNFPERTRPAIWLLLFDAMYEGDRIFCKKICEKYTREHPLFQGDPSLFSSIRTKRSQESSGSPDFELIDESALTCVHDSEIFQLGRGYGRLLPILRPQIPAWARRNFPDAQRYVRLNPWDWCASQPLMRLQEAALVPADPRWMSSLKLFPGMRTAAEYILQECDPSRESSQYIDYNLHRIRSLQISAERRETDYLSMMIEELPNADSPNGLMIGRCIHLDTRASVGTNMSDATLQHLDLAINVYCGSSRELRSKSRLGEGKVTDADYRTHLYRIEGVPFSAVFSFAWMFFKSKFLVSEWLTELGIQLPGNMGRS